MTHVQTDGRPHSAPRANRTWSDVRLVRAAVLTVLGVWAWAAPAAGQIIVLETLTAESVQDRDNVDELRLIVRSDDVPDQEFFRTQESPEIAGSEATWNIDGRAIFHAQATVRLTEWDPRRLGRERNQTLGETVIAGGASTRTREAVFNRRGSRYVLRYRVEPIPNVRTLELGALVCNEPQERDRNGDELRLRVERGYTTLDYQAEGARVPRPGKAYAIEDEWEGEGFNVGTERQIGRTYQATEGFDVELVERDGGRRGRNDRLGTIPIPAAPTDGPQTATFDRNGSRYTLSYTVR